MQRWCELCAGMWVAWMALTKPFCFRWHYGLLQTLSKLHRTPDCPNTLVWPNKGVNHTSLDHRKPSRPKQASKHPHAGPVKLSNHSSLSSQDHNSGPPIQPHNVILDFNTDTASLKCYYFKCYQQSQIMQVIIKLSYLFEKLMSEHEVH